MKFPLLLAAPLLFAAPAAFAAPAGLETVHVVRDGETLNGIANRAGVTAAAIVKANKLKQPYVVRVGQRLTIPRDLARKESTASAKPMAKVAATPASPARSIEANAAAKDANRTAVRVIEARKPVAGAAPSSSPETETLHIVQPGETLGGIAQRAKVPRVLIAEANGLQAPYSVKAGQKLQIPRTRRHAVRAGDSGFAIAMQYGVPWEQIALANSLDVNAPVKPGQTLLIPTILNPPKVAAPPPPAVVIAPRPLAAPAKPAMRTPRFSWPVNGPMRRGYAAGSDYHDGLDITAAKGTMVRAAGAGTVRFAGKEKEQFGNLVVIDHGDGWHTAYGFLSRVTVKEGASVAAGERVGLVGDTGMAKGSELHFEVRHDGKPVDPLDELPTAP